MPTYAKPKTPLLTMQNTRRDRIVACTSTTATRAFVTAWLSDSINQYGAYPDADNMSLIGIMRDLHAEKYKTADSRVAGGIIRHGSRTALGRYVYGQPLPSLQSWKGDVGTISTAHGRGRQATTQGQGQYRWERVTNVTSINFSNRTAKDTDEYEWYLETRNEETGAVLTKTPVGSFKGTAGSAGKWRHHWFKNLDPSKVYYPVVHWIKGYNQIFDGADELNGTEAHGHRWVNLGRSGSKIADFAAAGEDADGVGTNFSTLKFHATDEISGPDEYVITLGTNSPGSATTYADTEQIIKWVRKINPTCLIWLARPGLPGATSRAIWEYMIEQDFLLAHEYANVGVIPFTDIYTPGGIENWTPGNEFKDFMYGPLHPNYEGYKVYGRVGFNNLTGATAPPIGDGGDDGGEEGGGTDPVDTTGPLVEIISPADGQVVPVGGTVDFVFKVSDASGIGASRGIFAQPSGTVIGTGSPDSLPDLGTGYYGHRGVKHADLVAWGASRWSAVFRDASTKSNPTSTLARSLVLATTTAPATPAPVISGVSPASGTEFGANETTRTFSATITHPLGINNASVYAYGSGEALPVGALARVGTTDVWSGVIELANLKSSNRYGISAAANKAEQDTLPKTARSAEIPFTFATGVDNVAPTIAIQSPSAGTIVPEEVTFQATAADAGAGTSGVFVIIAGTDRVVLDLVRTAGTSASGTWANTMPREDLRASVKDDSLAFRAFDKVGNYRDSPPFQVAFPAVVVEGQALVFAFNTETKQWEDPTAEAAFAEKYGSGDSGVTLEQDPDGFSAIVVAEGATGASLVQDPDGFSVLVIGD